MNELRWILIGFGIVLLAAIYLWGRRLRPDSGSSTRRRVIEPEHIEPDYRELDVPPHLRNPEPRIEPVAPDRDENQTEPLDDDATDTAVAPSASLGPMMAHGVEVPDRAEAEGTSAPSRVDEAVASESPADAPVYRRQRKEPLLGPLTDDTRAASHPPEQKRHERHEPQLGEARTPEPDARGRADGDVVDRPGTVARPRRRIFAIRLVSPAGRRYPGEALLAKLQEEGLQHGRYGIFHRLDASGESIFSIASMVEPGSFDLDAMSRTEFPGLTLFTLLPGPKPGADAIMAMIACSDRLQRALGGALQDENGMPLQQSRLESMWSEASAFDAGTPPDASPSAVN